MYARERWSDHQLGQKFSQSTIFIALSLSHSFYTHVNIVSLVDNNFYRKIVKSRKLTTFTFLRLINKIILLYENIM